MEQWKEYRLEEIGTVVGGATPSTKETTNYDGEIPWITPKDLSNHNDRYIYRGERMITQKGFESCSCKMLPKGSVLFSSRAPIGYVAIAGTDMCTNQGFKSVVPNNEIVDTHFLYYLLLFNKAKIEGMGSGTTFKEVSGNVMKSVTVSIPNLTEQKRIADFLSSLDDKIELNRQINDNLEQQAQALFKSWFVDFEPFGGVKPESWRYGKLKELLQLRKESVKADNVNKLPYLPIDMIPMKSLSISNFAPTEEAQSSLQKFYTNDILIGAMRVYFHRVVISPCSGITRNTCFVLTPYKDYCLEYSLCVCNQNETINYAQATSKGSTMPYAVWDGGLADMSTLIPDDVTLNSFSRIIAPIISIIRDSAFERMKLENLRDTLLPRLMSGGLKIN